MSGPVMNFKRQHLIWLIPSLALVLLVAAVWIADAWLESPAGKKLLQGELSKSLGFPVRLEGDYGLALFPQLEIEGFDLQILQKNNDQVLASSERYSAAVDLRPLLNQEIRISSVTLSEGFMDLGNLPTEEPERPDLDHSLVLPDIALLQLENFQLHFSDAQSFVEIQSLKVKEFQPGRPSRFSILASLISDKTKSAQFDLSGMLTIAPDASIAMLDVQAMEIDLGDFRADGIAGQWEWNQRSRELSGSLNGSRANHRLNTVLQLELGEGQGGLFSGHLQFEYWHPEFSNSSLLEVDFSGDPVMIMIGQLDALLLDQGMTGTGCIRLTDPIRIDLTVKAGELDLDSFYSVAPVNTGNRSSENIIPELPFTPAIVIHADKTRLAGSVASDVQIEIGDAPNCPDVEVMP
jgi:hypothetical protein